MSGHLLCFIDEDEVMSTLAEGHEGLYLVRRLSACQCKCLPYFLQVLQNGAPAIAANSEACTCPVTRVSNVRMGPPPRQSKLPRDVPSSSLVRKTATEMPGNGYSLR